MYSRVDVQQEGQFGTLGKSSDLRNGNLNVVICRGISRLQDKLFNSIRYVFSVPSFPSHKKVTKTRNKDIITGCEGIFNDFREIFNCLNGLYPLELEFSADLYNNKGFGQRHICISASVVGGNRNTFAKISILVRGLVDG